MNEFTTLLVAKTDSSLVKILKSRYLVHTNEAVVAFSLTIRPEVILMTATLAERIHFCFAVSCERILS